MWKCPKCGRSFKNENQNHYCGKAPETIDEYILAEVYKRANISKKVFSKIRVSQDYTPKKGTILALAVSLKLDMDETQDLLSKAGYAFQPGRLQDLIIASFIRRGSYDINEINLYLFDAGEDLLGSNAV